MIYTAVVKDGGLFIPNIPSDLVNQVQQSQSFQVSVTVIKPDEADEIPSSMRQAVGLLSEIDAISYQNAQRADWD